MGLLPWSRVGPSLFLWVHRTRHFFHPGDTMPVASAFLLSWSLHECVLGYCWCPHENVYSGLGAQARIPRREQGDLAFCLWTPQRPLLSVLVLLSICIFLELEFSLFHLSSQHRAPACLRHCQHPRSQVSSSLSSGPPLSLWQLRFLPWLTSEVFVLLPEHSS
jgi:hypothetical protein